jgi:hypothetical protein
MRQGRRTNVGATVLMLAIVAGCAHNKKDQPYEPPPPPVTVLVKNENYLDMDIRLSTNGSSRRLGTVVGNSSGKFTVAWSVVATSPVQLIGDPIGGGRALTFPGVSPNPGQVVEFRIMPLLNQSTVTVHDPY